MLNKKNYLQILVALCILGIGILFGLKINASNQKNVYSVREKSDKYKFINPLLFVETSENNALPEYGPLKKTIEEYSDKVMREAKATDISVYFRHLNSSQWVASNPEATFSPASMLKVVTLIAVLRAAELDPFLLGRNVKVAEKENVSDIQPMYPPQDPIIRGKMYTVDDLLQRLIIDSDNIANNILHELIGDNIIKKTYEDLQISTPALISGKGYRTQDYSHLFRTLYNGTYLSRSISEQVLDLLSKTKFNKGIVAGVPEGTVVSHKFGARNIVDSKNSFSESQVVARELHDCGIIYYPDHPYFLCVMTRGKDFKELEEVIQNASQIVWEHIEKMY